MRVNQLISWGISREKAKRYARIQKDPHGYSREEIKEVINHLDLLGKKREANDLWMFIN